MIHLHGPLANDSLLIGGMDSHFDAIIKIVLLGFRLAKKERLIKKPFINRLWMLKCSQQLGELKTSLNLHKLDNSKIQIRLFLYDNNNRLPI